MMANGGKKKNKKTEESGRKPESWDEKMTREQQEEKEQMEAKRAIVAARVNQARMEQERNEKMKANGNPKDWMKKNDGSKSDGKRAEDNKRRDSLGGSVSTSSNSSGTDCDESVSDASKSAVTSPQTEITMSSLAPTALISDAISSINQVAQSVVEAGTVDALSTVSEFLTYTTPGKKKKSKPVIRNLAADMTKIAEKETIEEPSQGGWGPMVFGGVPKSSSSPAPRQVVTPILNGGTTTPSAELAAFRSISDDHPSEIPGANLEIDVHPTVDNMDKVDRSSTPVIMLPKKGEEVQQSKPGLTPLLRSNFSLDNPRSAGYNFNNFNSFSNLRSQDTTTQTTGDNEIIIDMRHIEWKVGPELLDANATPDEFFHDFVRSNLSHQFDNNGRGTDYSIFDKISREAVRDRPSAYIAPKGSKIQERLDMVVAHDTTVRAEKDGGLWLKGERAVLKNIYDDIPKLIDKQTVPWLRHLLQMIFEGQPKKVYKRMRTMANLLQHKGGFKENSEKEIYQHIANTLLEAGTNSELGYSYVHVLAAQGTHQKTCSEEEHKRCLTLQLVLGPLSEESLQKALSLKAREWRNRTPVHFAAATGQLCQLDALQKFRPDCTTPDDHGSTPIVYAVIRDNLFMMRMLSWYGADMMQTCDKLGHTVLDWQNVTGKFPLGKTCKDFIQTRNEAFERTLKHWMGEITSAVVVKKGLSEVHTLDCRQPSDQMIEKIPINKDMVNISHWIGHTNKTVHFKLRPNVLNEDRSSMFLIIIPFTYRSSDFKCSADHPDIVRRTLYYMEDDEKMRPIQFIPTPPFMHVKDPLSTRAPLQKALVPLLVQPNTGTFWAYKIPSDVFSNECLWVTLSLDLVKVDYVLRDNLRLLIQVVSLQQRQ